MVIRAPLLLFVLVGVGEELGPIVVCGEVVVVVVGAEVARWFFCANPTLN